MTLCNAALCNWVTDSRQSWEIKQVVATEAAVQQMLRKLLYVTLLYGTLTLHRWFDILLLTCHIVVVLNLLFKCDWAHYPTWTPEGLKFSNKKAGQTSCVSVCVCLCVCVRALLCVFSEPFTSCWRKSCPSYCVCHIRSPGHRGHPLNSLYLCVSVCIRVCVYTVSVCACASVFSVHVAVYV